MLAGNGALVVDWVFTLQTKPTDVPPSPEPLH
jgi:hypothetical protein